MAAKVVLGSYGWPGSSAKQQTCGLQHVIITACNVQTVLHERSETPLT